MHAAIHAVALSMALSCACKMGITAPKRQFKASEPKPQLEAPARVLAALFRFCNQYRSTYTLSRVNP